MSLFKKAHRVILSAISKRQEDFSLTATTSSKASTDFSAGADTKQKTIGHTEALASITHISFASAKEYLTSAQKYREQNDLYTARKIYFQGLQTISSDDPEYTSIVKEKQKVEALLEQRSQGGFYNLLPYDVLYMVFGNLEYQDLLRCARVCRQWFDFMMEWSEFWNKLALEMPHMNKSTLGSLLHHQTQELCFDRPSNSDLIHDIFSLLSLWENNDSIQKIYLKNLSMSLSEVRLLGEAIKCMSTSLKHIEWTNCTVENEDIIQYILPACSSGLTHVSFSRNISPIARQNDCHDHCHIHHTHQSKINDENSRGLFTITIHRMPEVPTIITPTINYSTLTCLILDKISHSTNGYPRYNDDTRFCNQFMMFIRECPNLLHLFTTDFSGRGRSIGQCLQQIVQSCPRLVNLVVSKNACMPHTIISNIDDNEDGLRPIIPSKSSTATLNDTPINDYKYNSLKKMETGSIISTSSGLRRLVLTQYNNYSSLREEHVQTLFKKYHASLELLYLDYDSTTIGRNSLGKLATYGCPRLREIRISTDRDSLGGGQVKPPMSTILVRLFSACPGLEVIELEEAPHGGKYRYMQLNGNVVETIAKKCPRLRHFHISDYRNKPYDPDRSCKSFLSFIDNSCKRDGSFSGNENISNKIMKLKNKGNVKTPSQLECLKVTEMDYETAYALVKNLVCLKYLHLTWWIEYTEMGEKIIDSKGLTQQIKNILMEREGSLVVTGPTDPWMK
ncbi:hypothetical protein BDA99DRAFT_603737 [Phascolomyces articulosus]|uniref:F-box domain-containing protein n=1 Tax=Phascolomyces articulosus TaxID=60185 RepID=A0AAD5K409_9FUNG|nr:hypothetical protein BDA99DRAFT_603737 [Phascolomyces articulosus]